MSVFADLVIYMTETDIINLFFPWLLLLAFTFGSLQKYEFFEDEAVTGAVSISSSFLAIAGIYFFLPEALFTNFGAIVAFGAFAVLGIMIVMAVAGIDISDMGEDMERIPLGAGLAVIGIGVLVLVAGALPLDQFLDEISLSINLYEEVIMPVMVFGFILAVIYLTSK